MCLKDILSDVFKDLQKLGVSDVPLGSLELEFISSRVHEFRGYMLDDDLIQLLWRSHLANGVAGVGGSVSGHPHTGTPPIL